MSVGPAGDGLEDLAREALAAWGGAEGAPQLVTARENVVFEARLRGGPRVALRLHRPGYQSRAGVESELAWIAALAGADLPVAAPVPARDGALTAAAGGRVASCTLWLEGAPVGAADRPLAGGDRAAQIRLMQEIGALAAALHEATDALTLPAGFVRPHWDEAGLLGEAPLWGRFWEAPVFDPAGRALLAAARAAARSALVAFRAGDADFGLIHADLLRENILAGPRGLQLIDFDDAGFGFRLYDLATALVQSLEEPALPDLAAALLAGYRSRRALDPEAEARLPLFVALRCFASAGWIATRAAAGDPRQRLYAGRALRLARQVIEGGTAWDAGSGQA